MSRGTYGRKSALLFGTRAASSLWGFASFYFVAHFMGPAIMGIRGFALGFVDTFAFLADFGLTDAHQKRVAEGRDLGRSHGVFFTGKLLLTAVMVLVVLGALFWGQRVLKRGFDDPVYAPVILITLAITVLGIFSSAIAATFAARHETAKQALPMFTGLLGVGLIIYVAVRGYGVVELVLAGLAAAVLWFLVSLYLFRGYPVSLPDREHVRLYLAIAVPASAGVTAWLISRNIDKVLLQVFAGPVAVGYLYAMQRVYDLLDMHSQSVGTVLFPLLAARAGEADTEGVNRAVTQVHRHTNLFLMPPVGLLLAYGPEIVRLVAGPDFLPAVPILRILAVQLILIGLHRPLLFGVLATGHTRAYALLGVLVALLPLGFALFLVPQGGAAGLPSLGLGATGMALSTFLARALILLLAVVMLRRFTGFRPSGRLMYQFVGLAVMLLVAGGLRGALGSSPLALGVGATASLVSFALILTLLRELGLSELRFYLDLVSPRKMVDYAREELRPALPGPVAGGQP